MLVTEADFVAAQRELVPSVSATELAHYERVRASFEGPRQAVAGAGAGDAAPSAKGIGNKLIEAAAGSGAVSGGAGGGKGKGKAVDHGSAADADGVDDEGLY